MGTNAKCLGMDADLLSFWTCACSCASMLADDGRWQCSPSLYMKGEVKGGSIGVGGQSIVVGGMTVRYCVGEWMQTSLCVYSRPMPVLGPA